MNVARLNGFAQTYHAQRARWGRDASLCRRALGYILPYRKRLVLAVVLAVVMSVSSGAATFSILPMIDVALETEAAESDSLPAEAVGTPGTDPQQTEGTSGSLQGLNVVSGTSGFAEWLNDLFKSVAGQGSRLARLITIAVLAFSLFLVTHAVGALVDFLFITIQAGGVRRLRSDTFGHLNNLPLSYFNKNKAGVITSRVENDIGGTIGMVTSSIAGLVTHLLMIVVFLVLLVGISPNLALVSLPAILVAVVITIQLAKWMRRLRTRIQENRAGIVVVLQEFLSAIRVTRAFAQERHEISKWEQ
ncbi:MAG: ABC transporter transmembrane domain-containing protein, partial [Dehalococcoidia bacterium]